MWYMVEDDDGSWMSQLRRGVLQHCVLALLSQGESYGFDIARTLSDVGLVASEGTIYPLLTRLRKDGLVETVWRESPKGPPRRYYRLTDGGAGELKKFAERWSPFRDAVESLLHGSVAVINPDGRRGDAQE